MEGRGKRSDMSGGERTRSGREGEGRAEGRADKRRDDDVEQVGEQLRTSAGSRMRSRARAGRVLHGCDGRVRSNAFGACACEGGEKGAGPGQGLGV